MIGDKIIAKPHHIRAAKAIFELLREAVAKRTTITIAGESGSGKSEIAAELAKLFEVEGHPTLILQQDDYFYYPPKTNHEMRLKDIKHVGLGEVNLKLLDTHLFQFKNDPDTLIEKPLVIFDEDRITREKFNPADYDVAIAEGTYTTCLGSADHHVFIDRTYKDTVAARLERGREKIDEFSERVLKIEHEIISKHKKLASIVVDADYNVFATPQE